MDKAELPNGSGSGDAPGVGRGRRRPGAARAAGGPVRPGLGPGGTLRGGGNGRQTVLRDGSSNPRQRPDAGRNNPDGARRHPREIGFKKLEELANDTGISIMEKLSDQSTLLLFEKLTCEKQLKEDWIRLVVTILSKVCVVEYKPIIVRLFDKICQKQFIDQLLLHITHLPYDKNNNRKETVGEFLSKLCILCSSIIDLTPNLACECLDVVLKRATQELEDLPQFEGYDEIRNNLKSIRQKLQNEIERFESMRAVAKPDNGVTRFPIKPPDDFRLLSHFPMIEDIVVDTYAKPFLRPNKVKVEVHGPFENVHDYLDVHYRLMREDFLRPLREGILEYRRKREEEKNTNCKQAKRIQNIRIYGKVKMLHVLAEKERVGIILDFDPDKKFAANIKWEYSKRLMNGSLLVLTPDDFASIVLVTVTKRDEKELAEGRVMVELCDGAPVTKELLRRQYLMVECQVFFGSYSHVLKALKEFDETSFPLRDYIVYASSEKQLPDYQVRALESGKRFDLLLKSDDPAAPKESVAVDIDNPSTWPPAGELGLDESQNQALCGALTNKLMLIQGPPGTGKTFIGLKIAGNLVKNKDLWRPPEDRRPILIVCYTNHALDQFLGGLLSATTSIVRVGGGCKAPELEQYSINFMRRKGVHRGPRQLTNNIQHQKYKFNVIKNLGDNIRNCSSLLRKGIISVQTLKAFGVVQQYFSVTDRALFMWLCGFGIDDIFGRTSSFAEPILDPRDAAYDHLNVPLDSRPIVSLSFSFQLFDEALSKLEDTPSEDFLNGLGVLKQNLITTEYSRRPWGQRELNPADLWRLNFNGRWQLYRYWRDTLIKTLEESSEPLLDEIDQELGDIAKLLATWRMVEDQHIMADHEIVGMTTSFAASRQENLKELKPRIVIVEEAAEVLESHVLVSLAGEVEHLIMIGDHQQLRPNASVHELAVKYGLNVSLFERLILNGVNCVTLSTQHRMRPEVAKLICPAIYPNLLNHPSVADFPAVLGVKKNVFFLNHTHPEEVVSDAQSFQNSHEAEFLSSLVRYLQLQGYDSSRMTVLSTYKGQQYYFSKLKREKPHLKDVRITVVDNYQGEEADLILLSLVRSNAEDAVGFLKTENRVCVALSRARHGLYMIGNMANMTAADTVWRKVEEELRRQDAIGAALSLYCERHGVVTAVSKAEDFVNCPGGGCLELCGSLMPCGHECKQVCHIQDMAHETIKCMEKCLRPACSLQHPCPELCFTACPPCKVDKVEELPCGHSATMPCHREPADHKCKARVESVTLPACGHQREAECHQLARLDKLPCKVDCTLRLPCGHTCRLKCHVLDDPTHEKVKCLQDCAEKRPGCTADPPHPCTNVCHQPCEDCTVLVTRTLPCGHFNKMACNADLEGFACQRKCERTLVCELGHVNKCSKKCWEPCDPCPVEVPKVLPCGHTQTLRCGQPADSFTGCKGPCQRTLTCGHPCTLRCGQACSERTCLQPVPFSGTPACGHPISVPCHQRHHLAPDDPDLLALCTHPCSALLKPCDHRCEGSCGACMQGRLHLPCKKNCERRLICGHICKEACPKACPPCTAPCEQKCVHSSCNHRCGEPCPSCKEACRRRCEHGQCPKKCGDHCSFECAEPCQKKLKAECGHDCAGLCGDPCLCRECNEEAVTTIFFGTEDEEGARFVKLPDCGHIFESKGLAQWMSITSDDGTPTEIQPKVCPQCKTPIISCARYSNVVKKVAKDIAAVKAQFYDVKTIKLHLANIKDHLATIPDFPEGFRAARNLVSEARRFLHGVNQKMPSKKLRRVPPLSTGEAENLEQKALILQSLGKIVGKLVEPGLVSPSGRAEMQQALGQLCVNLGKRDPLRLSEQEATDINLELQRLQRLVQLLQVEKGPTNFLHLHTSHQEVSKILRGVSRYSQEQDRVVQEKLKKLAEASSCANISRLELTSIVAALNMGSGHWYRCPKGHPYAIGDCGGAAQQATCPVPGCGARIGGLNHQLSTGNTRATDIEEVRQ